MICYVDVFAKSYRNTGIVRDNGTRRVYVTQIPEKEKAHQAVRELVAKHCGVSRSCVSILHGMKHKRTKVYVSQ